MNKDSNDINDHNHNEVIRLKDICSQYKELVLSLLNMCNGSDYWAPDASNEREIFEHLSYKLSPQEGSYPCYSCKKPVTEEDTCSSCGCRNEDSISIHVYRRCPYTRESLD